MKKLNLVIDNNLLFKYKIGSARLRSAYPRDLSQWRITNSLGSNVTDQETIQAVTSLRDSQIQRFYDTDNKLPLVNILIAVTETNQKMQCRNN